MPNIFAFFVVMVYPLIAMFLYKKMSVQKATFWTIVGGYMFLPVNTGIDLPLIPAFDKGSMPVLGAFLGCKYIAKQPIKLNLSGLLALLFVGNVLGPFITTVLNQDSLLIGGTYIPGMTLYDSVSIVMKEVIGIFPFFLGRYLFKSASAHLEMYRGLVIAGLIYSVLELIEIRLSPQLHVWIYGFFPHDFGQQMRNGGFRSAAFMGHGLLVSFFDAIVLSAAAVLWNLNEKIRNLAPAGVVFYLLLVLILNKSTGAIVYGLLSLGLIKYSSVKFNTVFAILLAALVLSYPILSVLKLIPYKEIYEWVEVHQDAERAQSLGFRFENEVALLDHVRDRFYFGWGSWGRNFLYNEESGKSESTIDGLWILDLTSLGFVGFLSRFVLYCLPVYMAFNAVKLMSSRKEAMMLASHAWIIGFTILDQLPNASMAGAGSGWLIFLIGILYGRSEYVLQRANKRKSLNQSP